jgi:colicin import membrane protein
MIANHSHKPVADFRREPKIGRYALLSLVLHLTAAVLFSGVLISRPIREHRPVYFVDLSKLPVANPRAGRPDGASQPAPKPAAPKPPPAAIAPPSPPKPKPEKQVAAVKPKPVKPVAKPKPKPEKPSKPAAEKPRPSAKATKPQQSGPSKTEVEKDYQNTLDAIKAMQAKAEREALKEKLAALATMDTRGRAGDSSSDVPLGMPDGTGDEAGVSQELWLQKFLKQNWSFSKYQASRRDLEATTRIKYDAQGNLVDYEFVKKSGDSNFDDSVTKAILKEKKLPFSPKNRIDIVVIFNLKDLMD